MGQRGPTGKPTKMKVLQGTFRKDRAPDNEAKPDIVKPEKPSWMKLHKYKVAENKDRDIMKYANEYWDDNAEKMAAIGLLTEIDIQSFAMFCVAYGEFINSLLKMVKQGSIVKFNSGHVEQHPYAIRSDKGFNKYRQMCKQFGTTPASRTGIEAEVKENGKPSREDILKGDVGRYGTSSS
jgi:P27 family predicted phage terminase small subunit